MMALMPSYDDLNAIKAVRREREGERGTRGQEKGGKCREKG